MPGYVFMKGMLKNSAMHFLMEKPDGSRVYVICEYIQLFESSSMNEVLESWQSLTDNDRDIIRMRYAEGKTVPEISALLGVKEASIYSALFRARKRLAEHLKKEKSSS